MSMSAFLVAIRTSKVLDLGNVLTEPPDGPTFYSYHISDKDLHSAIIRFLASNICNDVQLYSEDAFWELDLDGHECVNEDYGIYSPMSSRYFNQPDDGRSSDSSAADRTTGDQSE